MDHGLQQEVVGDSKSALEAVVAADAELMALRAEEAELTQRMDAATLEDDAGPSTRDDADSDRLAAIYERMQVKSVTSASLPELSHGLRPAAWGIQAQKYTSGHSSCAACLGCWHASFKNDAFLKGVAWVRVPPATLPSLAALGSASGFFFIAILMPVLIASPDAMHLLNTTSSHVVGAWRICILVLSGNQCQLSRGSGLQNSARTGLHRGHAEAADKPLQWGLAHAHIPCSCTVRAAISAVVG